MTSLTTAPATCSLGLALLAVLAAPAEASPPKPLTRDKLPKITGIELNVRVDTAYPCYLSVNASFSPSESGTIWYRFLGPSGVTFDMGPEGTMDVQGGPHSGAGVGKGAKMRPVIRGAFKVEVAYVRSNGKHGASTITPAAMEPRWLS
jgi:hypothetical protein